MFVDGELVVDVFMLAQEALEPTETVVGAMVMKEGATSTTKSFVGLVGPVLRSENGTPVVARPIIRPRATEGVPTELQGGVVTVVNTLVNEEEMGATVMRTEFVGVMTTGFVLEETTLMHALQGTTAEVVRLVT